MIQNFWYDGQIRQYLLQFISIFHGLQVMTGIGECGDPEMISVPVVVGQKDRVVAAIQTGGTQNRVFSLPQMAVGIMGISPADERRRSPGWVDQRVTMKAGGVFPQDLITVKRVMPVPYNLELELAIYASNEQQGWQILEQILVLFNPDIQIQKSDGPFDWTKITNVTLTSINNDGNYPSGTERRIVSWTLTFIMPVWISIPMGVKDDLIRKVIIQLGDLDSMDINQVDDDGDLVPFGEEYGRIEITTRAPVGPIPFQVDNNLDDNL